MNFSKCFLFRSPERLIILKYNLNNNDFYIVYHIKDLGVIFDYRMSFNLHVDYIVCLCYVVYYILYIFINDNFNSIHLKHKLEPLEQYRLRTD